jgi:hypothetical protein
MLPLFHEISPDCEKKTGVTIAVQTWKKKPHAETRPSFESSFESSAKESTQKRQLNRCV